MDHISTFNVKSKPEKLVEGLAVISAMTPAWQQVNMEWDNEIAASASAHMQFRTYRLWPRVIAQG